MNLFYLLLGLFSSPLSADSNPVDLHGRTLFYQDYAKGCPKGIVKRTLLYRPYYQCDCPPRQNRRAQPLPTSTDSKSTTTAVTTQPTSATTTLSAQATTTLAVKTDTLLAPTATSTPYIPPPIPVDPDLIRASQRAVQSRASSNKIAANPSLEKLLKRTFYNPYLYGMNECDCAC